MPDDKNTANKVVQPDWVPRVASHFRLQWEPAQQAYVLLYPEGMIKLNDSAGQILALCDGTRTVGDIIAALTDKFPEAENIDQDILEFFTDAFEQRWLNYE